MKRKWMTRLALMVALVFSACALHAQSSKTAAPPMDEEVKAQITEINQLFQENPEKANNNFLKMLRKMKDAKQITALGRYLLDQNNYPYAKLCGEKAYELDPTYIPALMLNGDICIMRKDWGGAGQKFDEALLVDSTLTEAMLKNAQVYKYVNPEVAKQMLAKLKRNDPSFTEADRMSGDIEYFLDNYAEAVKYYDTYFSGSNKPNLSSMRNYVLALFATKNHEKSLEYANKALAEDSTDVSMRRMRFYNLCELKEYDEATKAASYITNGQFADSVLTAGDYDNLGKVETANGEYDAAEANFKKALQKSPEAFAVYKNLSNCYKSAGKYDLSIENFKIYMDSIGTKANLADSLALGRLYSMALQGADENTPAEVKQKYLAEGDTIFAFISRHSPSFWGPLLRARLYNIIAQNKPDDKVYEYFLEAYNRLKDEEGNSYNKIDALHYLAFYTLQKDQYPACKSWCEQILKIDPKDDMANRIIKAINSLNAQ